MHRSAVAAVSTARASVVLAALIAAQPFAAPGAAARTYEFDQRRTEVRFVFTMGYATQRGRFTSVSGAVDFDDKQIEKSKIRAAIASESLTTGQPLVDDELKGAAFFNVKVAPVITFESHSVRALSPGIAEVSGDITVNGITKPVILSVSFKPHDDPALKHDAGSREFIAKTRIQRSAFNMTDYQSMVDDEVDIEIAAIVRPRQ